LDSKSTHKYTKDILIMSDPQSQAVLNYFKNSTKTPGNRMNLPVANPQSLDKFKKYDSYNRFQQIEQKLGSRPKRVIDKARHPNFKTSRQIFTPTLDHYEDMEWWERDASNDFLAYV